MEEIKENEVENKDTTSIFNYKKMLWWAFAVIVILCFICWLAVSGSMNNNAEAEKYKQLYKSEILANLKYEIRLDSAMKAMKQLASYQPLTSSMLYRDNVRSSMKYQPGDFARMKIDSSKVLIVDIVAGGDKYNYTIKYKIQKGQNIYEEISPQLLYG